MFRGRMTYGGGARAALLALACAILGIGVSEAADARSKGRRGDAVTGKMVAPNLEDHASYFSMKSKEITPEARAKADELRVKTMKSIEALLDSKKNSVRRFELLLRLGELHVERHDYLRDLEMEKYAREHDAWSKLPAKERGKEPKLDTRASTAELTNGANAFRKLVTEFPKHRRTDAALYALAKTLARLGKDTAADYYKQLLNSHPKSPLVPDATLALGEFYFERHNIDQALKYYKQALNYKKHQAYPYAVYKLGWAHYNASARNDKDQAENLKKAITAFKLVVKLSEKDEHRNARKLDLREEAIRDLIMVWAETEDVQAAWRYFKTIGAKNSFYQMLERLGHIYYDQGKNDKAVAVYSRILKEAPTRPTNPDVHKRLVELHDRMGQNSQVVAHLKTMKETYIGDTKWVQANRKDQKALEDARKLVEHQLHFYGTTFHQRGQKAKDSTYTKAAAAVYGMYLETFADNPNAYDIRFYLAEISFDFKRYEVAADHYITVAKAKKDGKYHKAAALNAVAAMNQLVQSTKYPQLPPAGQVPKPLEIPREKQKLISMIDEYVKLLPKEKDGEPMRFTAAQIYFDYGHYPAAMKRFDAITQEIPKSKQAKAAVKVILGYHADKQDWEGLIRWGRVLQAREEVLDPPLKKYVVDLLRGAMFSRALAYEKAGKHADAAEAFVAYQKEFPSDANADRALYNATLNYYKVGKVEEALKAGQALLSGYPKSEVRANVIADMASTHESLAQFDKAADLYRMLAESFPADKRAPSALFNAAMLYKGIGNDDLAVRLLARFVKSYPKNSIAADAALEQARILERQRKYRDAIDAYELYAKTFTGDADLVMLARAKVAALTTFQVSREKGAKDLDKVRRALVAKNAPAAYEARRIVAESLFKLLEPKFGEYQAMAIKGGRKIEQQVQAKQDALVKLAAGYEEVIGVGSAEMAVASLYRLGEAHENFSQALFKAPGPAGASQQEIDKFKTELEKVAFPLKEEAYKFFETAYKRSQEVQTFTVWTQRTYNKMVELAPEKHPEIDALTANPGYLSHEISAGAARVAGLVNE